MGQVKKLHIATGLKDLQEKSGIPNANNMKTFQLMQSAKKVHSEADRHYRDGDEELAYIFFLRYFKLLETIHNKPDYNEHKIKMKAQLGGNTDNRKRMDILEKLTESLRERYTNLKKDDDNIESAASEAATGTSNGNNNYSPPRDYEALSASEKFDLVKAGGTTTAVSAISPASVPSFDNLKSFRLTTCQELYTYMQENNVLVMDCRSKEDFASSHLTYSWAFNVPQEYISKGMSAGKLQEKLDSPSKTLWSARSIKSQIVLMDWNTKVEEPEEDKPIAILKDILERWDIDVTYKRPIKFLEGGYEYFIMMYPTHCTNPSVQAPQSCDSEDLLEEIEYPSIADITMKDDIDEHAYAMPPGMAPPSSPSLSRRSTDDSSGSGGALVRPPTVDRSSKLAAIKAYDEKQKNIMEIMNEQKDLLARAKANDDQLKQASQRLTELKKLEAEKGSRAASSIDNSGLKLSEQEVWYHLIQLESQAQDYKIENNRLREKLEKYKRLEREQQERLLPKEMEVLEEATKTIESKIIERQKMDEELEREKMKRDKLLAQEREHKRHLPEAEENDEISKAKIPQFDRSVKPQLLPLSSPSQTTAVVKERQRDFSPVPGNVGRGLTGLKNLGNTCYMNSILQCLSNTPQLTEYCITDKYKNYINRNNKTKGHIIEEVAALIKALWNGNYKCVASKDLRYVIGQYQQIFRGIEQQDSHEFLTILMDWLHSDLQTLPVTGKPPVTASEKAWSEFTKSKESLILHLFYGQIKSTIKCKYCGKESATYESFSNVSFELPPNGNVTHLKTCMDMYFSGESIADWNCDNCKVKREAIKKLDISKLPPVLVIHLKRFYADPDNMGSYKKKQNYLRFPLENLDMTPYIAKSELRSVTPKTYQLYGVSNHYGTMESGHYTAFCKSGNYGRWFKFDDQVVSALDTSNVVSSAAYILFYTWLPSMKITEVE